MLYNALGLQSLLRNTEEIVQVLSIQVADAHVKVRQREREGMLAIVRNRVNTHELALFVFKRSRLFGRMKVMFVFPVTKELRLVPNAQGFVIRWLNDTESDVNVDCSDSKLYETMMKRTSEMMSYQREPFGVMAHTHKWIWFYESFICHSIRDAELQPLQEARVSVMLRPEHYGKEVMETYIQEQLQKRETEYTTAHYITVFAGTWNCAGTAPSQSIVSWLRRASPDPDLIVLGLQEICSLNAANILGDDTRTRDWVIFLDSQVREAFPGSGYSHIDGKNLVGILLIVFGKTNLNGCIKLDLGKCVKLGLGGVTVLLTQGNKGAVGISFKVYDTSICIINSHLAPFKENVDERNEQFHRIVDKLKFQDDALKSIYEYDVVMWMGDLNYRIADLSDQRIDELVATQQFEQLSQCDQLKLAKETGKAFDDFTECQISFPPTYKFVIGGQEYNVGQG